MAKTRHIRVSEKNHHKLKIEAVYEERSITKLVDEICEMYFKDKNKDKGNEKYPKEIQ